METYTNARIGEKPIIKDEKVRYVLYARKSTESDEKQALSIESQVKEMLAIADRDDLDIVDIRRESHSRPRRRLLFAFAQRLRRRLFSNPTDKVKQNSYNTFVS